jgi:2-polyprenyl-6-hydroxyphenyl methylase/3-demethylubiquinone-9 3-methyltransferase
MSAPAGACHLATPERKIDVNDIRVCLWYDKSAEEAARFYAQTFPNSRIDAVHRAPGDFPSGKAGDVLVVDFTVLGMRCIGLNGGPAFKHSEAVSLQVGTGDQEETDWSWSWS